MFQITNRLGLPNDALDHTPLFSIPLSGQRPIGGLHPFTGFCRPIELTIPLDKGFLVRIEQIALVAKDPADQIFGQLEEYFGLTVMDTAGGETNGYRLT